MLTPGTYLQNRYRTLERIGPGGMSMVCKTRCYTLDRLIAIKVLKGEFALDENFVDKFKMEAQSAARLSHPNVVNAYDVVDEDMYHYIVMELTEGIILKNYIENKGYLESKEVIGIALQVGRDIAAAYEQHIIHRDIKPQNMVISRDGKVKVADFGIVRAVSFQAMNVTVVGFVYHISPEQAGGGYCDGRSDIYSFGITMYEMVTGRVPFEGDNTVTVVPAHLEEPTTPPGQCVPDMSCALEQIILKCTQKRPDRRYSCVVDVTKDLRTALMDPDADIYVRKDGEEDEFGRTRPITREELNSIQEGRKTYPEKTPEEPEEERTEHPDRERSRDQHKKDGRIHTRKKNDGDDVSIQFERITTASGIVAAIIIVAVVPSVSSWLTGSFRQSSSKPATEIVAMTTEGCTTVVDISAEDQINMSSILRLPQDMAREKLKESSLMMEVAGSGYSGNYVEGQVMGQDILAGTVVRKWSTAGVTTSKGSDKVDLNATDLTQMTGENARLLLEQKGPAVEVREENSDTIIKDNVIRFSPQVVKADEGVSLYVSKGSQNVEGRVLNLQGQTSISADAFPAGAGLLIGNVTAEASDMVEEGLIISQLEFPGTILPPGTAADYVVSGKSVQTQALDERYYIGSIDEARSPNNYIGPASQTSSVRVLIRLNQTSDEGAPVYMALMSPRLAVGIQTVPMVFPRIKGVYGVDGGMAEVMDADNLTVVKSYPAAFFPIR